MKDLMLLELRALHLWSNPVMTATEQLQVDVWNQHYAKALLCFGELNASLADVIEILRPVSLNV
jgi:hypothetical protein